MAANLAYAQALRAARERKGWSQREFAERAGLTQAHLSRIERGAIDPKVSTLAALARQLDLDLVLAPRQALTAVEAAIREVEFSAEARAARGAINRLNRVMPRLRLTFARDPEFERLVDRVEEMSRFAPAIDSGAVAAELNAVADMLEVAAETPKAARPVIVRAADRLRAARNAFVHPGVDALRPAYSLDEESDR